MDKELNNLYLGWVEDYCNVVFDPLHLPSGVSLAIKELVKTDPMNYNVTSEKLSDMAKTYSNTGDIPVYIQRWLEPYRRVHLVSNKEKKPYVR